MRIAAVVNGFNKIDEMGKFLALSLVALGN